MFPVSVIEKLLTGWTTKAYKIPISRVVPDTELTGYHAAGYLLSRDEDPDPVGSVDFWAAGSVTFFNGSGSYL